MKNKIELISFSEFLMIAPFYDQRAFFAPEIENLKNGIDGVLRAGLIAENEQNPLIEYRDNVALIKLEGPFRPGSGWLFSTGYGDIQEAIVELLDADVDTVIQIIDSPGGTVKGAFETEEMFKELAKEKNLISLITGSATSAAALMTFPASKRYLASKTAQTGSIGVVAEHIDNRSWYKEFLGEVRTSVALGRLKDAGTDVRGYDEKAKEVFSNAVTKLYDIFADAAVSGLGISREKIDVMQSRVYIGTEGIEQGFADGFATLEQIIEGSITPGRPAFINIHSEEKSMDIKTLEAEHPDVYKAVYDRGKDDGLKASEQNEAAGVMKERARITGIDALSFPDDFATTAKAEGWQPEEAALEFQKLEAENRKKRAEQIEAERSQPVAPDTPDLPEEPEAKPKTPEEAWEADAELRKEFSDDKERYLAFVKYEAKGRARILNKGGK